MNRTDRLHAISSALRTAGSRGRTAQWLADRFEVSTRTIKRDIAALGEIGVPISSQDGRGGGYQLMRNAALPPVSFTAAEATAVAIALAADPQVPFAADGAAALQKVVGAMDRSQRARARSIAARVWMGSAASRERAPCARQLDEALRRQVVVLIDYADASGRVTRRRRVEPMAFARTKQHWHLLAWCHTRRAGRWFRLDRVKRANLTRRACVERELQGVFGPPPEYALPVSLQG